MTVIAWVLPALLLLFFFWYVFARILRMMTEMPGDSFRGPVRDTLTPDEDSLRNGLSQHVHKLAGEIGVRHLEVPGSLERSAQYIAAAFAEAGFNDVREQAYEVDGQTVKNIEVEIKGKTSPDEILVVGAHYDSILTSPGANDNASGVAAVLELAKRLRNSNPDRTVRFVAFTLEERPHGKRGTMGSQFYARKCRERNENIIGMLALETMGWFSDKLFSQWYPPPFTFIYPSRGNFIGFIGDLFSREFLDKCLGSFRRKTQLPSEGVASWRWVPGVNSSDHDSFWLAGYRGLMITDTAPFRYPYYHKLEDTPDKLDYHRLAILVAGLERMLTDLLTISGGDWVWLPNTKL